MVINDKKVVLPIIIFLALALLSGVTILCIRSIGNSPREIVISPFIQEKRDLEINISGAVVKPGIYAAKSTDTLNSVMSSAGLTDNSSIDLISIYVHKNDEVSEPQKINLNRAEPWLLEALPGIGPARADDILKYRELNGPFKHIEDLMKIQGFGQSTFDHIKDLITVED